MLKNWCYLLLICSIVFSSCSIQKRVFRKGYHVVWDHHKKASEQVVIVDTKIVHELKEETLIASGADREKIVLPKEKSKFVFDKDTCGDVINLRNGDELKVKLVEIGEEFIKYKRCDNINGPTLAVEKKRVEKITYVNGGEENVVVLNEEGYQVANNDGAYTHVPKRENKLGNLSMVLHAVIYGISLVFLLMLLIVPSINWVIYAYVATLGLSFILPTTVAFLSLFQFKNEPEKYSGKWMPIYIIANKLWIFVALAVVSFGLSGSLLQQLIFIPLLLTYIGLSIYVLLPKKKKTNGK